MLDSLPKLEIDPIFRLQQEYLADSRARKVNLGIGLYADEYGEAFVLPVIQKAFDLIDRKNFDYLPLRGQKSFLDNAACIFFGDSFKNLAMQATCGGTHACRLFADLVLKDIQEKNKTNLSLIDSTDSRKHLPKIIIGTPTWGNHFGIFAGFEIEKINHLHPQTSLNDATTVNFDEYLQAINRSQSGDILLIHGGMAHNPTGINFSMAQTEELIEAINRQQMTLFVDFAYLGLGQGFDLDQNYLRLYYEKVENLAVAFSFSKCATLYKHRTGILFVKSSDPAKIESNLQKLSRESISMAPGFGQELMSIVFTHFSEEWKTQLDELHSNLFGRKAALIKQLNPHYSNLGSSFGLFGQAKLTEFQIDVLKKEYGIYISTNGRINFAGLKTNDISYVAQSFNSILA